MIQYKQCTYDVIEAAVTSYYETHKITVDSFWEDHVTKSNFYQIIINEHQAGFFAIHDQSMVTLFHMSDQYARYVQKVFEEVKRFEQVTNAFVPTGDEFFLSHAIDNFARLEKQAYFSIYTDMEVSKDKRKVLDLKRLKTDEEVALLDLTTDFFEPDSKDRILSGVEYFQVYKIEDGGMLVGFGVIEYGRIVKNIASIGMYVMPDKRQMGYAASILKVLQKLVESKGYSARSGCWYYNHNSKKSMESAGAFSKTRLLRFYF